MYFYNYGLLSLSVYFAHRLISWIFCEILPTDFDYCYPINLKNVSNYIAGKEKIDFICLKIDSQNNCLDCKPCLAVSRSGWELRTQLEPLISIALTVYFLSPPPPLW
jgi:hypothetical protein